MLIKVKDIRGQRNHFPCPIERAINEHVCPYMCVLGLRTVTIARSAYSMNMGDVVGEIDLPSEVVERVEQWDRYERIEPFEFELEVEERIKDYERRLKARKNHKGQTADILTLARREAFFDAAGGGCETPD